MKTCLPAIKAYWGCDLNGPQILSLWNDKEIGWLSLNSGRLYLEECPITHFRGGRVNPKSQSEKDGVKRIFMKQPQYHHTLHLQTFFLRHLYIFSSSFLLSYDFFLTTRKKCCNLILLLLHPCYPPFVYNLLLS